MNEIKIRTMEIDDYNDVYELWLSCKGMGLNNLDDSRESIERYLKRNPETCFVAVENSKTVGVILAGNDGRRGYIYHTAVIPDHRRKGIAKALVDTALEALHELGIQDRTGGFRAKCRRQRVLGECRLYRPRGLGLQKQGTDGNDKDRHIVSVYITHYERKF